MNFNLLKNMSCCILTTFILMILTLVAVMTYLIVVSSKDSEKNDWTVATCHSCGNFTVSGSGSCYTGFAICKYDHNNYTYEAYVKYPRTNPTILCVSKSGVTTWLESTKGKNVTCALEHIGQNTYGYPKCVSTTEKYCY